MSRMLPTSPSPAYPSFAADYSDIGFDPTGSLDTLVLGDLEGRLLLTAFDHDYLCRTLTDPSLSDADVPADRLHYGPSAEDEAWYLGQVQIEDEARGASEAWWNELLIRFCPAGVTLATYDAMCRAKGWDPEDIAPGFDPHPEDMPGEDDVPLPVWDDEPALACC